ncbi:MAG: hypothetical protein NTU47_04335 [Ignavibacteriales bacterium]|nr:hypothetical protein [Ignavibacteriales bacterium]
MKNMSALDNTINDSDTDKTVVVRSIPARKVAQLKLAMDGAERRMLRLKTELLECRAIIRRKYVERQDSKGNATTQLQLNPAQVEGYRLKRTGIEEQLAIASGDYLQWKRAYRKAVEQNIQVARKSVKMVREENRLRRDARALLRKTKAILEKEGRNGGALELDLLTTLAVNDDVKGFRSAFDEFVEKFDPSHYVTISGISSVKTEIIHALMDEFSAGKANDNSETLTGAVAAVEGGV